MGIARLALLALLQAAPPAKPLESRTLTSQDPVYRLEIPADYALLELKGEKPRYVRRYPSSIDLLEIRLSATPDALQQDLQAPYGFLRPPDLPAQTTEKATTLTWRQLPIYAGEYRYFTSAGPHLCLVAAIPLRGKGLLLRIQGPETREADLKADLARLAESVKGETDWTSAESKEDARKGRLSMLLGAGSGALYFALWAGIFRKSFRMAHGLRVAWLALTALLFLYPTVLGVGYLGLVPCMLYGGLAVRRIKMGIELG
jgi:hypothetical protein